MQATAESQKELGGRIHPTSSLFLYSTRTHWVPHPSRTLRRVGKQYLPHQRNCTTALCSSGNIRLLPMHRINRSLPGGTPEAVLKNQPQSSRREDVNIATGGAQRNPGTASRPRPSVSHKAALRLPSDRVPHPRRVFVLAARVGWHEPLGAVRNTTPTTENYPSSAPTGR
jgi:hypothetical protein